MDVREIEKQIGLLENNFQCPICLDLMKNPYSTRCDHKFCRHCILETIGHKSSAPCPICKVPFTKRSLQELREWRKIVESVSSLIVAFQLDTGTIFSPPHGASIPLSQTLNEDAEEQVEDESPTSSCPEINISTNIPAPHTALSEYLVNAPSTSRQDQKSPLEEYRVRGRTKAEVTSDNEGVAGDIFGKTYLHRKGVKKISPSRPTLDKDQHVDKENIEYSNFEEPNQQTTSNVNVINQNKTVSNKRILRRKPMEDENQIIVDKSSAKKKGRGRRSISAESNGKSPKRGKGKKSVSSESWKPDNEVGNVVIENGSSLGRSRKNSLEKSANVENNDDVVMFESPTVPCANTNKRNTRSKNKQINADVPQQKRTRSKSKNQVPVQSNTVVNNSKRPKGLENRYGNNKENDIEVIDLEPDFDARAESQTGTQDKVQGWLKECPDSVSPLVSLRSLASITQTGSNSAQQGSHTSTQKDVLSAVGSPELSIMPPTKATKKLSKSNVKFVDVDKEHLRVDENNKNNAESETCEQNVGKHVNEHTSALRRSRRNSLEKRAASLEKRPDSLEKRSDKGIENVDVISQRSVSLTSDQEKHHKNLKNKSKTVGSSLGSLEVGHVQSEPKCMDIEQDRVIETGDDTAKGKDIVCEPDTIERTTKGEMAASVKKNVLETVNIKSDKVCVDADHAVVDNVCDNVENSMIDYQSVGAQNDAIQCEEHIDTNKPGKLVEENVQPTLKSGQNKGECKTTRLEGTKMKAVNQKELKENKPVDSEKLRKLDELVEQNKSTSSASMNESQLLERRIFKTRNVDYDSPGRHKGQGGAHVEEDPYAFQVSQRTPPRKGKRGKKDGKGKNKAQPQREKVQIEVFETPKKIKGKGETRSVSKDENEGSKHTHLKSRRSISPKDVTNNPIIDLENCEGQGQKTKPRRSRSGGRSSDHNSVSDDRKSNTELEALVDKISEAETFDLMFSQQFRDMESEAKKIELSKPTQKIENAKPKKVKVKSITVVNAVKVKSPPSNKSTKVTTNEGDKSTNLPFSYSKKTDHKEKALGISEAQFDKLVENEVVRRHSGQHMILQTTSVQGEVKEDTPVFAGRKPLDPKKEWNTVKNMSKEFTPQKTKVPVVAEGEGKNRDSRAAKRISDKFKIKQEIDEDDTSSVHSSDTDIIELSQAPTEMPDLAPQISTDIQSEEIRKRYSQQMDTDSMLHDSDVIQESNQSQGFVPSEGDLLPASNQSGGFIPKDVSPTFESPQKKSKLSRKTFSIGESPISGKIKSNIPETLEMNDMILEAAEILREEDSDNIERTLEKIDTAKNSGNKLNDNDDNDKTLSNNDDIVSATTGASSFPDDSIIKIPDSNNLARHSGVTLFSNGKLQKDDNVTCSFKDTTPNSSETSAPLVPSSAVIDGKSLKLTTQTTCKKSSDDNKELNNDHTTDNETACDHEVDDHCIPTGHSKREIHSEYELENGQIIYLNKSDHELEDEVDIDIKTESTADPKLKSCAVVIDSHAIDDYYEKVTDHKSKEGVETQNQSEMNSDRENDDAENSVVDNDDAENSDINNDAADNCDVDNDDADNNDVEHDHVKNNEEVDNDDLSKDGMKKEKYPHRSGENKTSKLSSSKVSLKSSGKISKSIESSMISEQITANQMKYVENHLLNSDSDNSVDDSSGSYMSPEKANMLNSQHSNNSSNSPEAKIKQEILLSSDSEYETNTAPKNLKKQSTRFKTKKINCIESDSESDSDLSPPVLTPYGKISQICDASFEIEAEKPKEKKKNKRIIQSCETVQSSDADRNRIRKSNKNQKNKRNVDSDSEDQNNICAENNPVICDRSKIVDKYDTQSQLYENSEVNRKTRKTVHKIESSPDEDLFEKRQERSQKGTGKELLNDIDNSDRQVSNKNETLADDEVISGVIAEELIGIQENVISSSQQSVCDVIVKEEAVIVSQNKQINVREDKDTIPKSNISQSDNAKRSQPNTQNAKHSGSISKQSSTRKSKKQKSTANDSRKVPDSDEESPIKIIPGAKKAGRGLAAKLAKAKNSPLVRSQKSLTDKFNQVSRNSNKSHKNSMENSRNRKDSLGISTTLNVSDLVPPTPQVDRSKSGISILAKTAPDTTHSSENDDDEMSFPRNRKRIKLKRSNSKVEKKKSETIEVDSDSESLPELMSDAENVTNNETTNKSQNTATSRSQNNDVIVSDRISSLNKLKKVDEKYTDSAQSQLNSKDAMLDDTDVGVQRGSLRRMMSEQSESLIQTKDLQRSFMQPANINPVEEISDMNTRQIEHAQDENEIDQSSVAMLPSSVRSQSADVIKSQSSVINVNETQTVIADSDDCVVENNTPVSQRNARLSRNRNPSLESLNGSNINKGDTQVEKDSEIVIVDSVDAQGFEGRMSITKRRSPIDSQQKLSKKGQRRSSIDSLRSTQKRSQSQRAGNSQIVIDESVTERESQIVIADSVEGLKPGDDDNTMAHSGFSQLDNLNRLSSPKVSTQCQGETQRSTKVTAQSRTQSQKSSAPQNEESRRAAKSPNMARVSQNVESQEETVDVEPRPNSRSSKDAKSSTDLVESERILSSRPISSTPKVRPTTMSQPVSITDTELSTQSEVDSNIPESPIKIPESTVETEVDACEDDTVSSRRRKRRKRSSNTEDPHDSENKSLNTTSPSDLSSQSEGTSQKRELLNEDVEEIRRQIAEVEAQLANTEIDQSERSTQSEKETENLKTKLAELQTINSNSERNVQSEDALQNCNQSEAAMQSDEELFGSSQDEPESQQEDIVKLSGVEEIKDSQPQEEISVPRSPTPPPGSSQNDVIEQNESTSQNIISQTNDEISRKFTRKSVENTSSVKLPLKRPSPHHIDNREHKRSKTDHGVAIRTRVSDSEISTTVPSIARAQETPSLVAAHNINREHKRSKTDQDVSCTSVTECDSTMYRGADLKYENLPPVNKWVFVASGISKICHQPYITKLMEALGCHFQKKFTPNVTHVLLKPDASQHLYCARTLKYFQGIANRKWVLSVQWAVDCVKQKAILPMIDYEIQGDTSSGERIPHHGPMRSRISSSPLLRRYEICCMGTFECITMGEMYDMIESCGATVVKTPSMFSYTPHTTRVILVEQRYVDDMTDLPKIHHKYKVTVVNKEWFLDSVGEYEIKRLSVYDALNPSTQSLCHTQH